MQHRPLIFGLLGVLSGTVLSGAKEWWFLRRNNSRGTAFLAVQVVGLLDRYVISCASVVENDGLCQDQPDERGYSAPQAKPIQFEPELLKVEWRAIPVELMYEILDLPYKAFVAAEMVSGASENSCAPDYNEFFKERQLQFAQLGLKAAELGRRLRAYPDLPARSVAEWNPDDFMTRALSKIEATRAARSSELAFNIAAPSGDT